MASLFWIMLFILLYTWFGYYLTLLLVSKLRCRDWKSRPMHVMKPEPDASVDVVVAAYNEEDCIEDRVKNLLSQNYPKEKLGILIASDGSTDRTNRTVERLAREHKNVRLLAFPERRGKSYVLNESVKELRREIVVFSDAETRFEYDFVYRVARHFSEKNVVCVIGGLRYCNVKRSSISQAAGAYWRYEEGIRKLQSDLGLLAFGSGAGMAIRREFWTDIGPDEDVDRVLPLKAKLVDLRVVYDPLAIAYDYTEEEETVAHRTRVRKTSRAFWDVLMHLLLISPVRRPHLALSIFFHKTSRHLTPFYMLALLGTNVVLISKGTIYLGAFIIQIVFYILALLGRMLRRHIRSPLISYPYNFMLLNFSRMIGVIKSVAGRRVIRW